MKPILFNTEMVKAILEGRKTVTRRIADINDEITCYDGTTNHDFVLDNFTGGTPTGFVCRKCGFGVAPPHSRFPCGTSLFRPRYWPGDILYVREAWRIKNCFGDWNRCDRSAEIEFRAGGPNVTLHNITALFENWRKGARWLPSIHMPKKAARIFLRVKRVSVERLKSITAEQAMSEGFTDWNEFVTLWDSTIKPGDRDYYGWDANPWVWVYEFERCEKPKEPTHGK